MKYIDAVRSMFSGEAFPVFTMRDLKIALSDKGISAGYLRLLVHTLLSNDEITRITRGVYTFYNNAFVSGFAFKPFYYGTECALSMRGISTQMTNPVTITTRNVRPGVRTFRGRNYLIRRIDKKYFFGYELLKYGSFWMPVSDIEKTVIDMIYFGDGIRDELLDGINKSIDRKKLNGYLKRYSKGFREKVISKLEAKEVEKVLS